MVLTDLGTAEHPLRGVFLFVAGADSPAYPRVIFLSKEEKLQGRRRGILQKRIEVRLTFYKRRTSSRGNVG